MTSRYLRPLLITTALLAMAACSSSDSDEGGLNSGVTVSGTWNFQLRTTGVAGSNCTSQVGEEDNETDTLTQSGSTITLGTGSAALSGALSGRSVSLTAPARDLLLFTVTQRVDLVFAPDGQSATGTYVSRIVITDTGALSCEETGTVSGTRSTGGGGGGGGGSGSSLEVRLEWQPNGDYDLTLVEPGASGAIGSTSGTPSQFNAVISPDQQCGGSNVETISYATAPSGSWTARVNVFETCGATSSYTLTVRRGSDTTIIGGGGGISQSGDLPERTFTTQ